MQGDLGDALYVILKGSVSVIARIDGVEQEIARLQAGECFGELAVMSHEGRTASIRCCEPTDLMVINRSDFRSLVSHLPSFARGFEEIASNRRVARAESTAPMIDR
jgi:CRP-like cAMP-binding protein